MRTEAAGGPQSSVLVPQSFAVRRLLLVKPSSLGDVIHALPTARALRRRFPEAWIAWLVEEESADVVHGSPGVDEVILSGRRRWVRALQTGRGVPGAFREFRQLRRALRGARYDVVVDLQGLMKSAIFVAATGARMRIGLSTAEVASRAISSHVVEVSPAAHAVERYLRVAAALGVADGPRDFPIQIPPEAEREEERLLGGAASPVVVLHPVARWPTKHWTPEAFAAVGDTLADAMGASVVITGGGTDVGAGEAVRSRMRRPALNLAGHTPLKVLAALLRRAAVMVTVDSGPMHLAAALGTPLVALFGPTDPSRTGPYGAGPRRVLQEAMPCIPCLERRCRIREERLCMRSLDAQRVAAEALGVARSSAPV